MTEPETAGSDPTGLAARAELDGGEWVINGHKWFTSGYNGASWRSPWWSPTPTPRRTGARA